MPQHDIIFLKSLLGARGGLEKYTLRLAKAFAEKGLKVAIYTTSSKKRPLPKEADIDIFSLYEEGFFSFLNVLKFNKAVNKMLKLHPSKIVFGLDRNTFQTHYRAGNGVHAAYLERRKQTEGFFKKISFFLNPLHKIILKFEKKTFEDPRIQTIFTNSNLVKEEILYYYNVKPERISVVHNGVEWNELKDHFDQQSFNLKDPIKLLFVGHGYKRKGLDLLLLALSKLKKDFSLSIVGKDKKINEYKNLTKKLNISDKVTFFGQQKDIIPFYQKHDALVFPTTYDPFANVTLEALAMGLYVLTSTNNGASEILPKESGIIVKNIYDQQELINSLEKLCEQRKTKSSAEAIRQSVAHLEFENQLNKIINITLCPTQDISIPIH